MPFASASPPVPVGELVANKYRVERVLGQGGMGVVVAAMHEQLRQRVAIKMLLAEANASPNAVARFLREARAAAAIHGEHVAKVLDVGELEGGAPYIVMEYLEGKDFAALLAERGPLAPEEAVGFVLQACEAIAEAHAAGIIHRDLKPSNLFLARRPDGSPLVKVLDFGISKALLHPGGEGTLTTASSFVGSAVYSPPEQLVAAHDVDARADIWSLGTILFEALSGRPPYVGESMMQVASKIFHEPPTPLSDLRPELDPDLVGAVMKCLAKKPEDRFADVRALAEALVPFAPSASISAERVARIVSGSSEAMLARPSSHSGATSSVVARRAPNRWPLLAVAVAVAGVAVGWLVFSTRPPPAPAAAPSSPGSVATTVPLALPSASAPIDMPESVAPATASASASSSAPPARPPAVPSKRSPLSVGVK